MFQRPSCGANIAVASGFIAGTAPVVATGGRRRERPLSMGVGYMSAVKCHFLLRDPDPSTPIYYTVYWSSRVHSPKRNLDSAVFAKLAVVTNRQTHRPRNIGNLRLRPMLAARPNSNSNNSSNIININNVTIHARKKFCGEQCRQVKIESGGIS